MHARSLLLSTVLLSGMALGALTANPAPLHAADILRPEGSWTVSKVDVKQPGAVPYCALTRRFTNGAALTFARNPRQEGSLALDFPKAGFAPGKDVTIDLVAGPENRSFKTAPVSEHSIIVRMGEDGKFHQALEKSGQLSVSIAGTTTVYAMPDMTEGTQDLSACIARSVEPAAGDTPKMAAMPAPVVEKQKVEKLAAAAERKKPAGSSGPALEVYPETGDMQSVMEENIRLRNALERERREFENRFQQLGSNTSATAELAEKLRLVEMENDALKSKLDAQPVKTAATKAEAPATCKAPVDTNAAAMQELSALKDENLRLKASLDEQTQRVAMLQEKSAKQPSRTDDVAAKQVAALKDELARLEADNKTLKTAIAQKQEAASENPAASRQLKEAEAQLKAVTAERNRLSDEISSLKTGGGESRISIASSNWNLEKATERFNEAEREIRRLGSAVEQERAKCVVEKKELEYMLFDPKIATKEQVARLVTLEEELAQAKRDLENAGAGREKTEALESKVRDLEGRIADLSQRNAAYETQVRGLEEKLANTSLTLSEKQSAKSDQTAMVDALQKEISSLNAQLANMHSEKTAMAQQLSRIQPAAGGSAARSIARAETTVAHVDVEVSGTEMPVPRAPAAPVTTPIEKASVPAPLPTVAAAVGNARLMSTADIETLLRQAGVTTNDGVRKLENASATDRVAYRWQTQGLFGTAEQKGMESAAQFDRNVREYLENTKSRCAGEFASVPALEEIQGSKRISAYEIACVDSEGGGASAALTFYTMDGKTFTTVAHEALPEAMDIAMDARDRIIGALQGGKTVSRQ